MKKTLYILAGIFISIMGVSQENNFVLLADKQPNNTKVLWLVKQWPQELDGFKLAVKQNGEWKWLHTQPIIPALDTSFDFSQTDSKEASRLKAKLSLLFKQGKAKKIDANSYKQKISGANSSSTLKGLMVNIIYDFDAALINGFGMIVRTKLEDGAELGLFSVSKQHTSETPIAKCTLQNSHNQSISFQFESSFSSKNKYLQISWQKLGNDNEQFVGFNVYKRIANGLQKISNHLIPGSSKPDYQYHFVEKGNTLINKNEYIIKAVNIFGREYANGEFVFQPTNYPNSYRAAIVNQASISDNAYPNDAIKVNWQFPDDELKFVESFELFAMNLTDKTQAHQKLAVNSRKQGELIYKCQPQTFIKVWLQTHYKDGTSTSSNEQLIYYLPKIKAPKPQNLSGGFVNNSTESHIVLHWQKPNSDTLTKGYRVYVNMPGATGKWVMLDSKSLITETQFKFPVFEVQSSSFQFFVDAVSIYQTEGSHSDTITVLTPSKVLPRPQIHPYRQNEGKVVLEWQYPNIPDLKGFRVFQNGNLVCSEYELKKDARQFISPVLKYGANYFFTIQAVSNSGLISEISFAKEFYIFTKAKPAK